MQEGANYEEDISIKHICNLQTYFDRKKPRVDAVVSANVLACFYSFGRGQELGRTLQLVRNVLLHHTYMQGSHYYVTLDCCFFFFGRLLQSSTDARLKAMLGFPFQERTQERIGQSGSALDLAIADPHMQLAGFGLRR